MTNSRLSRLVRVQKALAHPVRLRVLAMLRRGPLCVCQMTAVLRLAASTVSAHLSELRRADLVVERKDGKWVEYRLADETSVVAGISWPELGKDPVIARDEAILRRVRKVALEELCRVGLDLDRLGIRLPDHPAASRKGRPR